jgi:hypothetical protein
MLGPDRDPRRTAAIRNLKHLASLLFGAAEDDTILVSELCCTEPGCPPVETVVAHLRAGAAPRRVKVHKPVVEVSEDDLRGAILARCEQVHDVRPASPPADGTGPE